VVGTAEEYAKQALSLVAAAPAPEKVKETEWMPLGVFAFAREGVADTQAMIELAVSKSGVVAGTYYNEATEVSRPVPAPSTRKVSAWPSGLRTARTPTWLWRRGSTT
jgi:hypothetical protein